jgi:PST family polysaccharide transporter
MFKDGGLSMATIQKDEINHAQVSALFWINLGVSAVLGIIVFALAPAVAWFYGEPRLVWITMAIACTFVFGGATVQHQALLRRQMRYGVLGMVDIIAMAVGIGIAIFMALRGFGYWALVGQAIGTPVANCIMVWLLSGWRPGLPRKADGIGSMLKFGGFLTGFNTINYFARNADNLLIGWWYGSAALGLYSKAYALLLIPVRQLNAPLGAVVAPSLSRLNDDPDKFRSAALRLFRLVASLSSPIAAALAVFAHEIVIVVLGRQWSEAVPIFQWLSIVSLTQMILNQSGNVFTAQGRSDLLFRCGLINSVLACVAIVVGLPFGLAAVAGVYAVSGLLLRTPILIYFLGKTGRLTQRELYHAIVPIVCLTGAVIGAGLGGKMLLNGLVPEFVDSAIVAAAMGLMYLVAFLILPFFRNSVKEAISLIAGAYSRKAKARK